VSSEAVTELLQAWSQGDDEALVRVTPLVHAELRRMARRHMRRERDDHTLQVTGLVNELYLRLAQTTEIVWRDRGHFFAWASRLMRRILVDFARARRADKRGAGRAPAIADDTLGAPEPGRDIVALDDALNALARIDERKSRVVELRYFGGLTNDEIAEALGVSAKTVMRDWQLARVWLFRELRAGGRAPGAAGA
jgi:RNA polymerase sigma-70 factor, ECF subfamily